MLRNLPDRESGCHPNTHEPLPRRESSEDRGGFHNVSLVWMVATVPDHDLIGSKWYAAAGVNRSPTWRLRK